MGKNEELQYYSDVLNRDKQCSSTIDFAFNYKHANASITRRYLLRSIYVRQIYYSMWTYLPYYIYVYIFLSASILTES